MNGLARGIFAVAAGLMVTTAALAAPDIASDKADAIKGHNRVVIAEFGVEFYTQINLASRQGTAAANMTSPLGGVGDADFQAITDKAYADTVAALTQAGFEVVDPAVLQANPLFQELSAKYGQAAPYTNEYKPLGASAPSISRIFAPAGMKAYFQSGNKIENRGSVGQRIDTQNQGRGAKEGEIAKAIDATLLHVNYLAAFGTTSRHKNNALFGGSKAKVGIEFGPVLWADDTALQFVTDSGARTFTSSTRMRHSGAVVLDEALVGPVNIFSSTDTTSAQSKRGDSVFNAVSGLLGSGAAEKHGSNETLPESPEAYRNVFGSLIAETATAFAARLAANR